MEFKEGIDFLTESLVNHSEEFVNEGSKVQDSWSTQKYIKNKKGGDTFEFIGDKHKKPENQTYKIKKNGDVIGSFSFSNGSYSVNLDGKDEDWFDTIDEVVNSVNESLVLEAKGKSLVGMVEDKLMSLYDNAKDYKQGVKEVKAEAKAIKEAIDRLLSDIE